MDGSHHASSVPEQSFFLPDSSTILKESWDIFRKRIVLFTLLSLPLLLGGRFLFDIVLDFLSTGFKFSASIVLYLLLFIIITQLIRNILWLQLHGSTKLLQSIVEAAKKLPRMLFFSFFDNNPNNSCFDVIYLLEDKSVLQAQKRSQEFYHYFGKEVKERLTVINYVFGLTIVSVIPLIYGYIITDNTIFLFILIVFLLNFLLSFIFRTIAEYQLYIHIKKYFVADAVSPEIAAGKREFVVADYYKWYDTVMARVFSKRLTRRSFWIGNVIVSVTTLLATAAYFSVFEYYDELALPEPIAVFIFPSYLMFLFLVIGTCIVYSVAFLIRRLHDMNMSAWSCLRILIPVYGLFMLAKIAFSEGNRHDNHYGLYKKDQTIREIFGF